MFERFYRKRILMEHVKFKATVSQGFEERSLQQWLSVLREMKRQTIIRSGRDFMTWNSELQLGCVALAERFVVPPIGIEKLIVFCTLDRRFYYDYNKGSHSRRNWNFLTQTVQLSLLEKRLLGLAQQLRCTFLTALSTPKSYSQWPVIQLVSH